MTHITTVHTEPVHPAPAATVEPTATATPVAYAGFWRRAVAFGLDLGLLFVLQVIVSVVTGNQGRLDAQQHPAPFYLLGALVVWLYFSGFEASRRHATPGKQAVGVSVRHADGTGPSFVDASVRTVVKFCLSLAVFGLGFLASVADPDARCWHDHAAGTYVVVA